MSLRALVLPAVALALSAGLIAIHLAAGGDEFAPARTADPCVERPLGPPAEDLEAIAEEVVLLGVQRAACVLGVSRERLVLALPSAEDRREVAALTGRDERRLAGVLRTAMLAAVDRLDRADRLPEASGLVETYVDQLGLPGIAEEAIRRIPDGIVDGLVPTRPVVRRALGRVDVLAVLRELDEPDALEERLVGVIRDAALAVARDRLVAQIPQPLRGFLGF